MSIELLLLPVYLPIYIFSQAVKQKEESSPVAIKIKEHGEELKKTEEYKKWHIKQKEKGFLREKEEKITADQNHIKMNKTPVTPDRRYQTIFVSSDLLAKTLQEYGIDIVRHEKNIVTCKTKGMNFTFSKTGEEPFELICSGTYEPVTVNESVKGIEHDYLQNAQEESYNTFMKNAHDKGMVVENEEILEDNSIVITLSVS